MTSREFNQDVSQAKRLARLEPVFVTDRGKPTHVLLGIDAFRRLNGENDSVVDLLAKTLPGEIEVRADARAWQRGQVLD